MRAFTMRSVAGQLMVLIATALVGLVVLALLSAQRVRTTMLTERKATLRSVVQEAVATAAAFEDQVQSGDLTTEEAQARTLAALNAQRFDPNGYLFGYTTDGTCFMLPTKTERVGGNFLADVDKNGSTLHQGDHRRRYPDGRRVHRVLVPQARPATIRRRSWRTRSPSSRGAG